MIQYLEWDSQFFSLEIGKATIKNPSTADLIDIYKEKQEDHYSLVYLFIPEISSEAKEWLINNKALLIDHRITFSKKVVYNKSGTVPEYSGGLTPELLALALKSGHKSRFNIDPRFRPRYKELYTIWMQKIISREMADTIFATTEDIITGFVSVKNCGGIGRIGLLSVNYNYQGKGTGRALLASAENWYAKNNLSECEVVTQQVNEPACQLYKSYGYSVKRVEYVFHL